MKSVFKAILLLLIGATSCTNHNADLIIHNARIYTVNDSFELASTLVVKDGKFIAVGNDDLLEKYSAAAKLDLKGIPIYPGLIDAHCHFYQLGLAQEHVDLRGAKSVEEVIARLKALMDTCSEFDFNAILLTNSGISSSLRPAIFEILIP